MRCSRIVSGISSFSIIVSSVSSCSSIVSSVSSCSSTFENYSINLPYGLTQRFTLF